MKRMHMSKAPDIWQKFRNMRNLLKKKIKDAKQEFINKALNSKTSKQIWQIIHRILSPCPDPIIDSMLIALIRFSLMRS